MRISLRPSKLNAGVVIGTRVICKLDVNEWMTGVCTKADLSKVEVLLDDGSSITVTGKHIADVYRLAGMKVSKKPLSDKVAAKYYRQPTAEIEAKPAKDPFDDSEFANKNLKPLPEDKNIPQGMKIIRWYDRHSRNWVAQLMDKEGNQLGEAVYVYSKPEIKKITFDYWKSDYEKGLL